MGIITYDQDTSHLYNEDGDFIGKIYREGDGLGPLIEERVNGWLELSSERDKLREQVKILREALVDLCDSQLSSRDRENAIARGLAALEATKEGA